MQNSASSLVPMAMILAPWETTSRFPAVLMLFPQRDPAIVFLGPYMPPILNIGHHDDTT